MYAVCTQGYHPKAYLTSPGRLQRSSRLRLQDEVGRAAAAADGAAATVEEGDLHTVFLTHLAGAPATWQCVKTLYPCSEHQNSWDLWMFIPLKMVLIGIDP